MSPKAAKATFTGRLERFADRLVGIASPRLALDRQKLRAAAQFSAYAAASSDRTRNAWRVTSGSADADLLPELETIRERSRELNRDDAIAASITQTLVDNVIGTGIRAQSRPDIELSEENHEQVEAFRKAAERSWHRWCCDSELTGRQDWLGLQRIVFRQFLENGEAFLVRNMRREKDPRPYLLSWDVVEADRVSSPNDADVLAVKPGEHQIRSGIEVSARGVPRAYYFRIDHPGDGFYDRGRRRWRRIPARDPEGRPNVLHFYEPTRPGQTRGVPFLHPVMGTLEHIAKYQDAALIRERMAACYAAFVTREDASAAAAIYAAESDADSDKVEDIEPGMVQYLQPGESVQFGAPSGMAQVYDQFILRNMRNIGAALGLPYELVAKDFSHANFSNARAASLEARRLFRRFQSLLISKVCNPSWKLLIEEAYLRGELGPLPNGDEDLHAWARATWVTPGQGWVDPQKEIGASEQAINLGVSTLADEAAAQGRDWVEVLEQQQREKMKREELGLEKASAAPPPGSSDDDEGDDTDEDDEETKDDD